MPDPAGLRLFRWRDPPVVAVALLALAAGFGQFGAVAALGDVAKTFGHLSSGASFADEAGLSGTVLGIGLAVIRLASLGGLPLAGLADRFGRRTMLVTTCAAGLLLTVAAALSPDVLVVRRHLRPRPSVAQRHPRRGPGERGRADGDQPAGPGGGAHRRRLRRRGRR